MKRAALTAGRVLVTLFLLFLLFQRIDRNAFLEALRHLQVGWYALAVLAFLGTMVASALRWYVLLKPLDPLPFWPLLKGYLVGLFVGNYLPSGGIDVVRGVYVLPYTNRRAPVFASVVVDRMVGFLAITTVILVGLPWGVAEVRPYQTWLTLFSAGVLLAAVLPLERHVYTFVARWLPRMPLGNRLLRLYEQYYLYRTFPGALAYAYALSFLILLGFGLTVKFTALGLGSRVPLVETVFFVAIINVLAMIPVTISGFGLREGGFVAFFGNLVGAERALALSLLFFGASLITSLLGALILLFGGTPRKPMP